MPYMDHFQGQGRINSKGTLQVPCFPLYSMLLALNMTAIDYFSLDIEGDELTILKTIPFNKVDITVLSVEYVHGDDKRELKQYMKSQGYEVHEKIHVVNAPQVFYVDDYIFVKKYYI